MTVQILKIVNSSFFSLQQPITNINHAILYLGSGQVKDIAMQLAVQQEMKFTDVLQNKAYNKLWLASYIASAFCTLLINQWVNSFIISMLTQNTAIQN